MEDIDNPLARARTVLGLTSEDGADALRSAFHRAVKAAHPDRPGGDAARLREVVAAYRLLKAPADQAGPGPLSQPHPAASPGLDGPGGPVLEISPLLAFLGGQVTVDIGDRSGVTVDLPPGLRAGDRLPVDGDLVTIRVGRDPDLTLRGDDLWRSQALPGDAPRGGRVEVATPGGAVRNLWVGRRALAQGLLRVDGEGLPARGDRPAGDLFVTLQPAAPKESALRRRLRAFEDAWAPRV
ncbi:MAG: molecular chaperone DnaJ [Caulobacter sp.]|nr:molecular chaperone DnaJ [Caulobacter sp.]